MKQELGNWIKISIILSILFVAAVKATELTSDVTTQVGHEAQSSIVMNIK